MCISEGEPDQHRRTQSPVSYSPNSPGLPSGRKYQGFGGFPGPVDIVHTFFKRATPSVYRRFERSLTIPHTRTLDSRSVPWLSFDGLVVGRNSDFRTETLDPDQIEEIGGTEYRALRLLSYLVPVVRRFNSWMVNWLAD